MDVDVKQRGSVFAEEVLALMEFVLQTTAWYLHLVDVLQEPHPLGNFIMQLLGRVQSHAASHVVLESLVQDGCGFDEPRNAQLGDAIPIHGFHVSTRVRTNPQVSPSMPPVLLTHFGYSMIPPGSVAKAFVQIC